MAEFKNDRLQTLFILFGLLWFWNRLFRIFYRLFRLFQIKRLDLNSRYGQGSYVLITGSSDGIGRGLAEAFALRGFNLILVSRTQAKLQAVQKEINQKCPKIDIKIFALDFTNSFRAGFFDELFEKTKHLDISIIINNAALDACTHFLDAEEKEYLDLIICNTIPVVTLTKKFLPLLLQRKKRSAVINMSSISGIAIFY